MPELPEVETIKEALNRAVNGAVIQSVLIAERRFRIPIPDDFATKITGAAVKYLRRVAKYVIIDLDNGLSIVWHFGMSGRVRIISRDNLDSFTREKHDHVIIYTNKCTLVFNDARRFGLMTYLKTDELYASALFAKLGIDPFDERLNKQYLFSKLKDKHIPIKVALLDQSIICGIGNIYASEALYLARISPLRLCKDISLHECQILIGAIKTILQKAILAGGSTLKDYRQPDGSMGYFQFQHAVYGKEGMSCPDCQCEICKTGGIKKIIQAGRSTFYCNLLQK